MSRSLCSCVWVLAASLTASGRAAVIVTPGPPPDPENYIHLSIQWSFSHPAVRNSATGGVTNNPTPLINDSLWFPRNTTETNPRLEFVLEDPNDVGWEGFDTRLGAELNSGFPEFNLHVGEVLSSEEVGDMQFITVRRLTFTAPGGYFRQTPEPGVLTLVALAAVGLGAIGRRR